MGFFSAFRWPTFRKAAPLLNAGPPVLGRVPRPPGLLGGVRAKLAEIILGANTIWDQPVWTDWNAQKAIADGFKSSTWVFACVTAIAQAASSVPWFVEVPDGTGKWKKVENHPLGLLLERPNKRQSRQDVIERMAMHMWLAGNGFLYKVRSGKERESARGFRPNGSGPPIELWALEVDRTRPVTSREEILSHYVFDYLRRGNEGLPVEDIIHFMFCDPANQLWGMAPLQAVAKVVDTDVESKNWWKVSLQRKFVKDGILTFKESLSDEQYDEANEAMNAQAGSKGARGVMVVGEPATFTPTSMTPQELDWTDSSIRMAIEICAGMRVPPPIVGLYDQATYNNIQTARKIFWLDTIVPFLEELRSTLDRALVPDFEQRPGRLRVNFDLSDVEALKEDLGEKVKIVKDLHTVGVPADRACERLDIGLDLSGVEGADKPWLPSTMVPVEDTLAEDPEPEPAPNFGDFGQPPPPQPPPAPPAPKNGNGKVPSPSPAKEPAKALVAEGAWPR